MRRVMIVGGPGSGKSTLARALGARSGLPVFHMDLIHWQSGWVERSKPEKDRLTHKVHRRDAWISRAGIRAPMTSGWRVPIPCLAGRPRRASSLPGSCVGRSSTTAARVPTCPRAVPSGSTARRSSSSPSSSARGDRPAPGSRRSGATRRATFGPIGCEPYATCGASSTTCPTGAQRIGRATETRTPAAREAAR